MKEFNILPFSSSEALVSFDGVTLTAAALRVDSSPNGK